MQFIAVAVLSIPEAVDVTPHDDRPLQEECIIGRLG
jgi:hypothetical protein